MRKQTFLVLAALMLSVFLTLPSLAEEPRQDPWTYPEDELNLQANIKSGDYFYVLLQDGSVLISWYAGKDSHLVIPSSLDNHPVTQIGRSAFEEVEGLESVVLPEGIEVIGAGAFARTYELRSIQLPETLEIIEGSAFFESNLSSIRLPDGLEALGTSAFENCPNLKELHLPEWLRSISENPFSMTPVHLSVSEKNTHFELFEGGLYTKGRVRLISYPAWRKEEAAIISPDTIIIGSGAFANATVASVRLPEGLAGIQENAFWGNMNLREATLPDSLRIIGSQAFSQCDNLQGIHLPAALEFIGDWAFDDYTEAQFEVYEGSVGHDWVKNAGVSFTVLP